METGKPRPPISEVPAKHHDGDPGEQQPVSLERCRLAGDPGQQDAGNARGQLSVDIRHRLMKAHVQPNSSSRRRICPDRLIASSDDRLLKEERHDQQDGEGKVDKSSRSRMYDRPQWPPAGA